MLNLRCQMSESVFGRACVRARASVFYQTAMKSKTEFLHLQSCMLDTQEGNLPCKSFRDLL